MNPGMPFLNSSFQKIKGASAWKAEENIIYLININNYKVKRSLHSLKGRWHMTNGGHGSMCECQDITLKLWPIFSTFCIYHFRDL